MTLATAPLPSLTSLRLNQFKLPKNALAALCEAEEKKQEEEEVARAKGLTPSRKATRGKTRAAAGSAKKKKQKLFAGLLYRLKHLALIVCEVSLFTYPSVHPSIHPSIQSLASIHAPCSCRPGFSCTGSRGWPTTAPAFIPWSARISGMGGPPQAWMSWLSTCAWVR